MEKEEEKEAGRVSGRLLSEGYFAATQPTQSSPEISERQPPATIINSRPDSSGDRLEPRLGKYLLTGDECSLCVRAASTRHRLRTKFKPK
jgi:hypothetical protein